jgi:hypothetical protein
MLEEISKAMLVISAARGHDIAAAVCRQIGYRIDKTLEVLEGRSKEKAQTTLD